MFLTKERAGYNRDNEQVCHGLFLCIFNKEPGRELRCIVRHVRMRQCGQWMMDSVQVGAERIVLSGDYGGDGLPISTHKGETERIWDRLHALPPEVTEAYWKGEGGWNCAGSEGHTLFKWARANVDTLRKLRKTHD